MPKITKKIFIVNTRIAVINDKYCDPDCYHNNWWPDSIMNGNECTLYHNFDRRRAALPGISAALGKPELNDALFLRCKACRREESIEGKLVSRITEGKR